MKRLTAILTLIAAFALAGCLKASAQSFWIGPEAGFNASWITHTIIDPGDKVLPHNNFYAGIKAAYDFGESMIGQMELLYAGKGHTDRNAITDYKYSRNLSYIQLPLLIGYKLADEKFHILVGPDFGYLIKSTTKSDDPQDVTGDTTADCNRFNIAAALQLAYYIIPQLGIDIRFDIGLNRTFHQDFSYGPFNDQGRNLSVQLGVCYRFEL